MTIYAYSDHHEIPLSSIDLTLREEIGILEQPRRHQLPHDWQSPISRFLVPESPKPISHHPFTNRRHVRD